MIKSYTVHIDVFGICRDLTSCWTISSPRLRGRSAAVDWKVMVRQYLLSNPVDFLIFSSKLLTLTWSITKKLNIFLWHGKLEFPMEFEMGFAPL